MTNEINWFADDDIKPSSRPLIYIAGPYAPLLNRTTSFNRAIADEYGRQIFKVTKGLCDIFIPHNTHAHWEEYGFTEKPHREWFISFDLRILAISSAIFLLPLWDKSKGAKLEYQFAIQHNIAILQSMVDVRDWLTKLFPKEETP